MENKALEYEAQNAQPGKPHMLGSQYTWQKAEFLALLIPFSLIFIISISSHPTSLTPQSCCIFNPQVYGLTGYSGIAEYSRLGGASILLNSNPIETAAPRTHALQPHVTRKRKEARDWKRAVPDLLERQYLWLFQSLDYYLIIHVSLIFYSLDSVLISCKKAQRAWHMVGVQEVLI